MAEKNDNLTRALLILKELGISPENYWRAPYVRGIGTKYHVLLLESYPMPWDEVVRHVEGYASEVGSECSVEVVASALDQLSGRALTTYQALVAMGKFFQK